MTSSKNSDVPLSEPETCATCGGVLVERPARPAPFALQLAFGVSFVLFLLAPRIFARYGAHFAPPLAWGWTAIQALLGFALMRARRLAARRVFRCVRCA